VSAAHANYQAHAAGRVHSRARAGTCNRIAAEPGHPRESQAHMAGVVEQVVLSSGRALIGVTGQPVELGPGDYICYRPDLPHVFEALSRGTLASAGVRAHLSLLSFGTNASPVGVAATQNMAEGQDTDMRKIRTGPLRE